MHYLFKTETYILFGACDKVVIRYLHDKKELEMLYAQTMTQQIFIYLTTQASFFLP